MVNSEPSPSVLILYPDLDHIAFYRCTCFYPWLIIRSRRFLFLVYRIKGVVEQVKQYTSYILWDDIHVWRRIIELSDQFCIKTLIYRA